jgi:solute carrier family 25 carnitine/acylcarnitine transporter 20/29
MAKYQDTYLSIDITSFLYGAISGGIGAIASHPVDTYKSIVQTNIQENKKIPKFYNIHIKELYRGLRPSIASIVLEKAVVLGVYANMKQYTNSDAIAGGVSGFFSSFPVTICERLKILKQIKMNIITAYTPKTNIITSMKSYFSGLSITFTREVPGFAIYFSVYNKLKGDGNLSVIYNFINGALAGTSAWIFIYPQDSIKTIIQGSYKTDKKITDIAKNIYANGGIRSFYKGFHLCVIRACLLHGSVLATMEYINKLNLIM